jgi:hypothetical protein
MTGRGRLSSIELLGEDYDDIVAWAAGELRERRQLQTDILGEFNARLEARAFEVGDTFEPISKSAFGRYSLRLSGMARRLEHTREISKVLTERLQPGDTDRVTIALAEAIKSAVFEAIGESGEAGLGMMDLKFAGDALKSAVAAQKTSAELRGKIEAQLAAKVEKAVNTVAGEAEAAGRTIDKAEVLRKIREDVYGIFDR